MTQDEIIRMARDAGLTVGDNLSGVTLVCVTDGSKVPMHITLEELERFAALVASHEREKCFDAAMKAAEKAVDTAMLLEREACAKVCDEVEMRFGRDGDDLEQYGANQCAAAIRARK